jgi:hypothetical protein
MIRKIFIFIILYGSFSKSSLENTTDFEDQIQKKEIL